MKTIQYISRGITSIILMVVLYSYLCSVLCASEIFSCCNEKEEVAEHFEKNCSDQKEHEEHHDDDCQKDHLAFFGTISQYHFIKTIDVNIFQPLVAIILSKEIIQPLNTAEIIFAYNGFHPPPPKENLLILIQRFLI